MSTSTYTVEDLGTAAQRANEESEDEVVAPDDVWARCAASVFERASKRARKKRRSMPDIDDLADTVLPEVRAEVVAQEAQVARKAKEVAEAEARRESIRANRSEFPTSAPGLPTDNPENDLASLLRLTSECDFPPFTQQDEAAYLREEDADMSFAFPNSASLSTNPRSGKPYVLGTGPKVKMSGFRRQFVFGTSSQMEVVRWDVGGSDGGSDDGSDGGSDDGSDDGSDSIGDSKGDSESTSTPILACHAVVLETLFGDNAEAMESCIESAVHSLSTLRDGWAYVTNTQSRHLHKPTQFQPVYTVWLAGLVDSLPSTAIAATAATAANDDDDDDDDDDDEYLTVRAANDVLLSIPITTIKGKKDLVGKSDVLVVRTRAWEKASALDDPNERLAAQLGAVVSHIKLKSPFTYLASCPAYQPKEQILAESEAIGTLIQNTRAVPGLLTDGFVLNISLRTVNADADADANVTHWLAPRVIDAYTYVLRTLLALSLGLGNPSSQHLRSLGVDPDRSRESGDVDLNRVLPPYPELDVDEDGDAGPSDPNGDDDGGDESDGGDGDENIPGTRAHGIRQLRQAER